MPLFQRYHTTDLDDFEGGVLGYLNLATSGILDDVDDVLAKIPSGLHDHLTEKNPKEKVGHGGLYSAKIVSGPALDLTALNPDVFTLAASTTSDAAEGNYVTFHNMEVMEAAYPLVRDCFLATGDLCTVMKGKDNHLLLVSLGIERDASFNVCGINSKTQDLVQAYFESTGMISEQDIIDGGGLQHGGHVQNLEQARDKIKKMKITV